MLRPVSVEALRRQLASIFTNNGGTPVVDVVIERRCVVANIVAGVGGSITFRFGDMPAVAKIFGTDSLDFTSQRGDDICDSVTFDGHAVLTITAYYESVP